jgi:hypothetical protein
MPFMRGDTQRVDAVMRLLQRLTHVGRLKRRLAGLGPVSTCQAAFTSAHFLSAVVLPGCLALELGLAARARRWQQRQHQLQQPQQPLPPPQQQCEHRTSAAEPAGPAQDRIEAVGADECCRRLWQVDVAFRLPFGVRLVLYVLAAQLLMAGVLGAYALASGDGF